MAREVQTVTTGPIHATDSWEPTLKCEDSVLAGRLPPSNHFNYAHLDKDSLQVVPMVLPDRHVISSSSGEFDASASATKVKEEMPDEPMTGYEPLGLKNRSIQLDL